jgi:flagellar motor protein MotB
MTGVQVSKSLSDYNYQLSYERAKSLARFWLNSNVLSEVGNYDLQIVGSGDGMMTATGNMRETDELSNQRFLICIIPKIGSIEKGE